MMAQIRITKDCVYKGSLILVNPSFPLKKFPALENMQPAIPSQPQILIHEQAATLLQAALNKIQCKDEIIAVSGFRTKEEQEKIWNDSIEENGSKFTQKFVAVPKHSEHHTGLAIDLAENKEPIDFICPAFPHNGICQKFREVAPRFGFVERYIAGKESITSIGIEPWHFRYVGYPHSVIMAKENIVLEEYIHFLKENTDFKHPYIYHSSKTDVEIFYISLADKKETTVNISEEYPYLISGTNEGGVVISIWKEK